MVENNLDSKLTCSHCQLEYAASQMEAIESSGEILYFCCNGCKSVYFILKNCNLDSFYDKLNTTLKPPKEIESSDLARFDTLSFMQKYTTSQNDNIKQVNLIISGIFCSACIWLNEKILSQYDGIISASINYTNNKAQITWDSSKLALSEIIRLIRSIGYDAYPYDVRVQEDNDKKILREYYIKVIVGLFCTMNIMWVAIAQYSGFFLGIDAESKDILNLASFVLCTPALFYSGSIFYRSAFYGLKNGFIGMDLLVCVGSSLAYFYSIYAGLTRSGETYFESVSMIITFVLIGKFLEIRSKKHAGDSLDKLSQFLPQSVQVCVNDDKNNISICSPEEVKLNSLLLVLPGEKIAIDGELDSNYASFDTKAISGESIPLECAKGEKILSGYVNLNQAITYRTTKLFNQSMMSHIISIVESSLTFRPRIQNLANSISQYFSRTILSIAILCFLGWFLIGESSLEKALMNAISVIIIACPCALALATPIASVVGIGEAYKKNVLFKQASFLETLSNTNLVVFDKTGTLTNGTPQVIKTHLNKDYDKALLSSFVNLSTHPVANGIKHFVESKSNLSFKEFKQLDSKGIYAKIQINNENLELFGGSLEFLRQSGFEIPNINIGSGMLFCYGIKSGENLNLIEIFELKDEIKPSARELIAYLKARKIDLIMLSGDRDENAKEIADLLQINYESSLNPMQKAAWIESYKHKNKNCVVVMVGDGINDALALSKSDIAIAMGNGSDIALLCSDAVILDDKLATLKEAFKIAKNTFSTIRQNIALSIGYNALTIPLALAGLVIPLFAALSMSLSSVIVVLNSLRLKNKS